MNKSLLVITLVLISLSAVAQTGNGPGRISLNVGVADPFGDFNQPDFKDDYPVFAQTGTRLTLSYARDLHRHLAAGASLSWRRNPFDFDAFYINNDPFRDKGEATAWQTGFAMADVYVQAPVPEAVLYAKASAGAALARTASYKVPTDFGTIQQEAVQAASFAWGLGVGLRQEFGNYGFNLEVDLVAAKPTFKTKDNSSITYQQQLNTFGATLGLSHKL